MNLYLALTGEREPALATMYEFPHILLSYHYYENKVETILRYLRTGGSVFIDSGAFSAENSNKTINIHEYIKWLHVLDDYQKREAKESHLFYAVLDDLRDAAKTYENQMLMEQNGLRPVPVFHMGENMEFLLRYLHDDYDYIALGGMVMSSNIESWLDKVWALIIKHKPNLKVHGFGMTNMELVKKYPWHSCDSSSFKAGKRFGRVPILRNGKIFNKDIREIHRNLSSIIENPHLMENNKFFNDLMDIIGAYTYIDFAKMYSDRKDYGHIGAQKDLFDGSGS